MSTTTPRPLRIAVVGAGPAGLYAVSSLLAQQDHPVSVDVLEALPAPFGLVRYGVAPDHPKMRNVTRVLRQGFTDERVRFLGNVAVIADEDSPESGGEPADGPWLTDAELSEHYHAVIYATGASEDRKLGIPGEELAGSVSATELVRWYCGHPQAHGQHWDLSDVSQVVVIGAGNVALDIARLLLREPEEMRSTDVAAPVLASLIGSAVQEASVLARRGPVEAKFTAPELKEFNKLAGVSVRVEGSELQTDASGEREVAAHHWAASNLELFRRWAADGGGDQGPRTVRFRFLLRPVEILGSGRVSGVRVERTELDGTGAVRGTGERLDLPAQLVVRAVGYRSLAVPGLPFDAASATVPHRGGRVLAGGADAAPVAGRYVTGWLKRGPNGVIGTNKPDAAETVTSLLADARTLPTPAAPAPEAVDALLTARSGPVLDYQDWQRIESAETENGRGQGRGVVKLDSLEAMLAAARGATV